MKRYKTERQVHVNKSNQVNFPIPKHEFLGIFLSIASCNSVLSSRIIQSSPHDGNDPVRTQGQKDMISSARNLLNSIYRADYESGRADNDFQ